MLLYKLPYLMVIIFVTIIGTSNTELISPPECICNGGDTITIGLLMRNLRKECSTMSKNSKLDAFYRNKEYLDKAKFGSATDIQRRTLWHSLAFVWLSTDLFKLIWRYPDHEAKQSRLKTLINRHCDAQSSYYLSYIHDFRTLGLNKLNIEPIELQKAMFSEQTLTVRGIPYKYIQYDGRLNGTTNPDARYIMLKSLRFTTDFMLDITNDNYKRYLDENKGNDNIELEYLGSRQSDNDDNDFEATFNQRQLTHEQYKIYFHSAMNMTRHIINDVWDKQYDFITKHFKKTVDGLEILNQEINRHFSVGGFLKKEWDVLFNHPATDSSTTEESG